MDRAISSPNQVPAKQNQAKQNQLEELFIWKVSDELKLSTTQEKKFADTLRDLSQKKQILTQVLEDTTMALIKAQNASDRKKHFVTYRKKLIEYNKLAVDELDQMNSIFGPEKMAHYLEVKLNLTNKVKALMLSPEKSGKEKKLLPTPQVIQE